MLKKSILMLISVMLLSVLLQTVAFAADIPINYENPECVVDTEQVLNDNNNPKANAFDNDPETRWAANVADDVNSEGKWSGTVGNQSINLVCPLEGEYTVNSVSVQFPNATGRMYCLNIYVSDDNKTWTAVELTGVAKKSTYTHSVTMVSPIDCFILPATVPGEADKTYSQVFDLEFATPTNAKYIKFTGYGYKNEETGDGAGTWVSLTEIKIDGEEYIAPVEVEAAPVVETTTPAVETTAPVTVTKAPQTDNTVPVIFCILIIASAVSFGKVKKNSIK